MTKRLAFSLLCLLLACGDDDDDPSPTIDSGGGGVDGGTPDGGGDGLDCSGFTACGGDLEGTWSFVGACGLVGEVDVCKQATVDVATDVTGSLAFGADDTYQLSITIVEHLEVVFPAVCLAAEEITDCAQLEEKGVECEGSAARACTCVGDRSEGTENESGTYSVAKNVLAIDDGTKGDPEQLEYCVSGDQLRFRPLESDVVFVLEKAPPR